MSTASKLKELAQKKKLLNEEQRRLRELLNTNKDQRKASRKVQAEVRGLVLKGKAALRELTAETSILFSKGTSTELHTLADNITNIASTLAESIRQFADATKVINET